MRLTSVVVFMAIISGATQLSAQPESVWRTVMSLPGHRVRGFECVDSAHCMAVFYQGYRIATHVLKSSDGGRTWSKRLFDTLRTPRDPAPQFIFDLAYPALDTAFIAADSGVVYRTTDGGSEWLRTQLPGVTGPTLRMSMYDGRHGALVADYPNRLFVTEDGGILWREIPGERFRPLGSVSTYIESVATPSERRVVIEPQGAPGSLAMARSDDLGETWTTTANAFPDYPLLPPVRLSFLDRDIGFGVTWLDQPDLTVGPFLTRTTDGGLSWETVLDTQIARTPMRTTSASFANRECGLLAGSRSMARTTNGGATWELDTSITNEDFEVVQMKPGLPGLAIGSQGNIYRFDSEGASSASPSDRTRSISPIRFEVIEGIARVWANGWIGGSPTLSIVSARGDILRTVNLQTRDDDTPWQIDLRDLAAGLYFMSVSTRDGVSAVPIVLYP